MVILSEIKTLKYFLEQLQSQKLNGLKYTEYLHFFRAILYSIAAVIRSSIFPAPALSSRAVNRQPGFRPDS